MQRGDVQVTRRDERRPSRRGILLGLLPLTLLAAALVAAPAGADPQFAGGCRVQLTGEEGASGPQAAELTWACANFKISSINIASESDTPKQFIAGPLDQQGFGLCTPAGPGDSAECNYNPQDGAAAGTIPISAMDVCGTDDNEPLVFSLGLTAVEEGGAEFSNLPIQCAAAPPTPTTPTTTTPSAAGPPGGTGGGFGGGTGGGTGGGGGVRGAEDSGQVPLGGVQSGAGGTAPADDGGAGLLAAVVGLTLAATLGLGIARVRSVRG